MTIPTMMPGQEPYTEEEYENLTILLHDAALEDPEEENEDV